MTIAAIAPPTAPHAKGAIDSRSFIAKSPTSSFEGLSGIAHVEPSQMVEGDSKSPDMQSACFLRPPLSH
jgi:hypothetical protein